VTEAREHRAVLRGMDRRIAVNCPHGSAGIAEAPKGLVARPGRADGTRTWVTVDIPPVDASRICSDVERRHACPTSRVGDHLDTNGEKQREHRFDAIRVRIHVSVL
jgi:hypothetical protein